MEYFKYGNIEIDYLKRRDKKLGEAIDAIGPLKREVFPDLFSAMMNSIVGQQISTKAWKTVWNRILYDLGEITPYSIYSCTDEQLQSHGITFKKAAYMRGAAKKVLDGSLDLESLYLKDDDEVCKELIQLDGIGVWTSEMLMLLSMQRPDVLSYGDLAIIRGMRMLYHHREISKPLFEKYRRRYSPYGSVASLYLWAIAGGAIEGMKDYAPKKEIKK